MTMTVTERASFNLLDCPWIPVTTSKGEAVNVSLLDIGRDARSYLSIGHPDPLVAVAVHRFVLAFLHRALDGPKTSTEAGKWYRNGFPIALIEAYAEKWRERFDLFSPDRPFLQQPGIEREKFKDRWTRLLAARSSGNTNLLFRSEKRPGWGATEEPIEAAEAALYLLGHQPFALAGTIQRFVTVAKASPLATATLTVVQGANLLQTLCMNLVPYGGKHAITDLPCWERELPSIEMLEKSVPYAITGLTSSYVFPARSVLLIPDRQGRVLSMYYAAGLPPADRNYIDPMITLVKNSDGVQYYFSYKEERGLWRDLHCFVPSHSGRTGPEVISHASELLISIDDLESRLYFTVYGMKTGKKAGKIALARQESLRLPAAALRNPELVDRLECWVTEVDAGAFRLKVALQVMARALISSVENCDPKDVKAQVASFQYEGRFWPAAEAKFWTFIDSLSPDPDEFLAQYDAKAGEWTKTINRLVRGTYDQIASSLGRSAKTLRAIERGRMNLRKGFQSKTHDNNTAPD